MDRRRFSPSAERLEGRELLSLFGGGNTQKQNTTISVQDLPKTYKQKTLRIAHLPYYLLQENPDRFLPANVVASIQDTLNATIAELDPPGAPVVDAFNANLRSLAPDNTLSPANAALLNSSFGAVLAHAGAAPEVQATLQADMNALALVDSQSVQPSMLARQDYALIMQTTLAVGRPQLTPYATTLKSDDGVKILGGKGALTHDQRPTFVGTYPGGASKDGDIWMQIVDQATGQVLGTAPVTSAGTYSVKLSTTLPNGNYTLVARSSDEVGHLSLISRPFILGVKQFIPRRDRIEAAAADVTATTTTTTAAPATTGVTQRRPPPPPRRR